MSFGKPQSFVKISQRICKTSVLDFDDPQVGFKTSLSVTTKDCPVTSSKQFPISVFLISHQSISYASNTQKTLKDCIYLYEDNKMRLQIRKVTTWWSWQGRKDKFVQIKNTKGFFFFFFMYNCCVLISFPVFVFHHH